MPAIKKAAKPSTDIQTIKKTIEAIRSSWKVPGCAVAVIQDNQVILAEGFGVRDIKTQLPVTPETLFPIASCTKAFTTFAMGLLVDEKKLDWDKPVRNYLPQFKLYNDYVTENMTPRDLVTHRSGLPRYDLMWYMTGYHREEIVKRLQYLEPTKGFREVYQYNNLMYLVAGYMTGLIAGTDWETFIKTRIFEPLKMKRSNFSVEISKTDKNHATGYEIKKKQIRATSLLNVDPICPAGGINSTLNDLISWVKLHLNSGKLGQRTLLSTKQLGEMYTPSMITTDPQGFDEILNCGYALGWSIRSYRGTKLIAHSGSLDGFTSLVSLHPQSNTGIIVLNNLDNSVLPPIVTSCILDILLKLEPIDWSGRYEAKVKQQTVESKAFKQKMFANQVKGTKPSHPLKDYAGTYAHAAFGEVKIQYQKGKLSFQYHHMAFILKHHHYDTFHLKNITFGTELLSSFQNQLDGTVSKFCLQFSPLEKEIQFLRVK